MPSQIKKAMAHRRIKGRRFAPMTDNTEAKREH